MNESYNATHKNMKYDEQIMLAVFEHFLKARPENLEGGSNTDTYFKGYVEEIHHSEPSLVLWHIAVLFDEFLIKQNIIEGIFGNWRFDTPHKHLNRSGQILYDTLKQKYPQN